MTITSRAWAGSGSGFLPEIIVLERAAVEGAEEEILRRNKIPASRRISAIVSWKKCSASSHIFTHLHTSSHIFTLLHLYYLHLHFKKWQACFRFPVCLRPVLIVGGPASGKHSVVRWLAVAWLQWRDGFLLCSWWLKSPTVQTRVLLLNFLFLGRSVDKCAVLHILYNVAAFFKAMARMPLQEARHWVSLFHQAAKSSESGESGIIRNHFLSKLSCLLDPFGRFR